jgi:hypothetical protein
MLLIAFTGCIQKPIGYKSVTGRVTKIYEVPTYEASSILYHIVLKDSRGVGYDVIVSQFEAAQHEVNDTTTLQIPIYKQ